VKFVVEHSVSTNLTQAIAALAVLDGDEVVHLRTHYHQATLDPVWLRGLGAHEPEAVVISADPRITRSPHEQAAWLSSGLTTFFLRSFADLSIWDQAAKLVKWWPEIVRQARAAPRGTGFLVSVQGRIERLRPPSHRPR
jgi:hypothetical protein